MDKDPDMLGSGGARKAADKVSGRKKQIDAAVDEATGDAAPPAQKKQEPAKEKMSTHLMNRIAEKLRNAVGR